MKEERFKVEDIFDEEIMITTTTTTIRREKEEKDQARALVYQKGETSASVIYTNIGTMYITAGAILKDQIIQLKQATKKEQEKAQKKDMTNSKISVDAQGIDEKRMKVDKVK